MELNRRAFNAGLGFLGPSSSKEITKPLEASVSSFNFSVFMAANISASSSVKPTPELERSEEGPEFMPSELRRLCLKAELSVGRCLEGEGEASFSWTR